jgi:hypothetical protein
MYILWWHKPLLPNEPFIVGGDWVEPLCAYMYMSSDLSGEVETKESQTIMSHAVQPPTPGAAGIHGTLSETPIKTHYFEQYITNERTTKKR